MNTFRIKIELITNKCRAKPQDKNEIDFAMVDFHALRVALAQICFCLTEVSLTYVQAYAY